MFHWFTMLSASICLMIFLPACYDEPTADTSQAAPSTSNTQLPTPRGLLSQDVTIEPSIDTSPLTAPPEDDKTLVLLGLTAPKPATWLWKPPTRSMRKANFVIPGREGAEAAELVVNHFPEAPGNTLQANLNRWSKQFRMIDGGTPTPIISTYTADTMPITVVELSGEYMGMGGHWHQPDQRMLMTMVESPAGTVFFKLLGPDATVEANRESYMKMVQGLQRVK